MASEKNQQMKLVGEALAAAIQAIGGEPREGQIQMAEAVANALTDRHHLLVQAGTGTGKSLAYLVPALVHGKKVLVATATLALQRQLVERDLPRIQPALERVLKRELTFAVYKGVGNYLCLQKMNGAEQDPDGEFLMEIGVLEKDQKRLKAWAQTPGVSGDRDDAPEVDRRVWFANSVSGRECIGKDDCAFGSQLDRGGPRDAGRITFHRREQQIGQVIPAGPGVGRRRNSTQTQRRKRREHLTWASMPQM